MTIYSSPITGATQTALDLRVTKGALVVDVRDAPYNAVLDGTTSDTVAINSAITDVSAVGGGTVYIARTTAGCAITSSGGTPVGGIQMKSGVKLLGNNTKLVMKGACAFILAKGTIGTSATITADTTLTTTNYTVNSSSGFTVGALVEVQLGQAAYDVGEPDFYYYARVTAVPDSTHITLDTPAAYVMTAASVSNAAHKAISLAFPVENFSIEGFYMENSMTGGANSEEGVYIQRGRHFSVDRISGLNTGAGVLALQYAEHGTVGLVECISNAAQNGQGSKGRALSFAESRNITVQGAFLTGCENAFVFIEAACESITIKSLRINNTFAGRANTTKALIAHVGHPKAIRYEDVWVGGNAAYFYDPGSAYPGSAEFINASFYMSGDPAMPQVANFTGRLQLRGVEYRDIKRFSKSISVTPSMAGVSTTLPAGLYRRLRVFITSTTGVTAIRFNSNTTGANVVSSLVAGATADISASLTGLGTNYPLNNVEAKTVTISSDGTVVANNIMTIEGELYTPTDNADDGFQGRLDSPVVALQPTVTFYGTPGSFTFTKPANATLITVATLGAGGGGGSGRRSAAGVIAGGGSGGSGGALTKVVVPASSVSSTVTVTVGAGGSGGAAVTTDDTNGNVGVAGGLSSFGLYARGSGGPGGLAGTTTGASAPAGSAGSFSGGSGGSASATGAVGSGGGNSTGASGGGGGGGGITSGDVASSGGTGGFAQGDNTVGGTAGSSGGAGGVGQSSPTGSAIPTTGGGGGASATAAAAGAGGAGGTGGGAGGGGGGGSRNTFASGAGGAGSDGAVLVIVQ